MTGDASPSQSTPKGTEQTEETVVMRFPRPSRFLSAFLPEQTVRHLYAARRERLLAMRSFIDAAIDRIDQAESEIGRGRRTKIRID
jgi:hypothetical protein